MRDTYRYQFKIGNLVLHGGITNDLERREQEHKNSGKYSIYNGKRFYWKDGHICQVGLKVSRDTARKWERDKGYGLDQHK